MPCSLPILCESHLGHGLDELAERWLGLPTVTYESLCGEGAEQIRLPMWPLSKPPNMPRKTPISPCASKAV